MSIIWLAVGKAGLGVQKLLQLPTLDLALLGRPVELGMFSGNADVPWLMLSYLPIGVLVLVVVSLLTRPEPDEALRQFYTLIRTPVGDEAKLREQNVDIIYEGSTTPHKWEYRHSVWVDIIGFAVALAFSFVILGIVWILTRIGA
jgi:hypothetical protein